MIQLQNIYKIFNEGKPNEKTALEDVSLTIGDEEFVAIKGKSGAGKSTLMNILGCLDIPSRGVCVINGKRTDECTNDALAFLRHEMLGIITQTPFLIGESSALENVMLPLYLNKLSKTDRVELATNALKDVGLLEQLKQRVSTLSGGEQQRVAIARALINNPAVILADEPTGSLDSQNAKTIMNMLGKINESGKIVIIVTHDDEIAKCCRRIITLGDGKIISDITE